MKYLFLSLLIASVAFVGLSSFAFKSNLFIPPSQEFELGGGPTKAFKTNAVNIGDYAVEVFLKDIDSGKRVSADVLETGDKAVYQVPARTSVILRNLSDEGTSNLRVRFQGSPKTHGMQYFDVE